MTPPSATLLEPDQTDAAPGAGVLLHPAAPVGRHPALIVQPRHGRPAPALIDVLLAHDLDAAVVAASPDESLPDPEGSPLAVLIGSDPLSAARENGRLEAELEWVGRADAAGTALLGIGHGARVLALAFGGDVRPAPRPLRGWSLVDTKVPHLVPTGPWLAWQHDVITLPPAATLLAGNRLGPQAFQVSRHLGVQFHPEATPDTLAAWARGAGSDDGAPTGPVAAVRRDDTAAANSTWRLLSSFIESL